MRDGKVYLNCKTSPRTLFPPALLICLKMVELISEAFWILFTNNNLNADLPVEKPFLAQAGDTTVTFLYYFRVRKSSFLCAFIKGILSQNPQSNTESHTSPAVVRNSFRTGFHTMSSHTKTTPNFSLKFI